MVRHVAAGIFMRVFLLMVVARTVLDVSWADVDFRLVGGDDGFFADVCRGGDRGGREAARVNLGVIATERLLVLVHFS